MKLPQAIRGLFKREDKSALLLALAPAPKPRRSSAPTTGPSGPERTRLKHFESRLKEVSQDSGESGRLQMIALSRVKERLGDEWPRRSAKVHRLTEQIIQRRLADADVYVRVADRYMLLFAELSSVEATFKAQAIAREITALLIGELPEVDETPLQITVHEIDASKLSGTPTLENLVANIDDVAAAEAPPFEEPAPSPPPFVERGPASFDYLPIWSRRGKAVVGYVCTCRQGGESDGEDPYELDCLALRTVLATLPDMERNGHAALVVAPIHWDTLVQLQRRQGYLDLCRHMSRQLNRRLGFSVSKVAAGAWHDLIRDRLSPLKPFARFFFVCAEPDLAQIRNLADIGVDALAFDAMASGDFDDAQRQRIGGFVRDASRYKLATCALGISERSTALTLLRTGVDFLGGDAVAPRVDAPGAAYRLDLAG